MDNCKMYVREGETELFPYIQILKDIEETNIKIVNYLELYYTTVTISMQDGSIITS